MRDKGFIIPMPVSPIEKLTVHFRDVLHLPDPGALQALMGAVAANMISGPPVWLMFVGAPSCGKSELLNSLLTVPRMVEGADISGEPAFLSGSSKKDIAPEATGGLLHEIGNHGGLILNDFTSLLSKPSDKLNQIMSVFRETYSGRWTRMTGGEGGRHLSWTGKLAIFGGVTSKIDQHHQIAAELGERWIYYRFEPRPDEAFHEIMMTLTDKEEEWRETLCGHVKQFFEDLKLSFHTTTKRRSFTDREKIRIHRLALVGSRCRSSVPRDSYTKEIIAPREQELPVRLASVIGQLLIGMNVIGVPERTRWQLLTKIVLDSMPRIRRVIVENVAITPINVSGLMEIIGCSESVARRAIEDLEIHGIVERNEGRVCLTEWMTDAYKKIQDTYKKL